MENNADLIKCVVVGASSVGKSSILLRYANNDFDQFNEPTLGAAFVSKSQVIDDKPVKFQIWDTAGQEKYQSIAPIYYKKSQIALCVYDISSRPSFVAVNQWVKQLQNNGPENMMMVVVANKCDISESAVSYQQGIDFATSIGAMFKLVSAKDGSGINEMFISIGRQFLQRAVTVQSSEKKTLVVDQTQNNNRSKKKCC